MASSVFRTGLFNNKVAIVTGGGTGIGKAITAELLQLGKHSGDVIHGFELNLRTTDGETTGLQVDSSELCPR